MMDSTTADVVIRNTPTIAVAGATFNDWFVTFPIAPAVQWLAGAWILVQAGFYLYDRYRKR